MIYENFIIRFFDDFFLLRPNQEPNHVRVGVNPEILLDLFQIARQFFV